MTEAGAGPDPLADWVARRARTHPQHVAIETAATSLRYAELDGRVASTAAAVRALDPAAGQPVAVLLGNGIDFAVFAHAVPRAGAAFLSLNTRLAVDELTWQLRNASARALIVDHEHRESGGAAASTAGVELLEVDDERWKRASTDEQTPPFDPSRAHSVVYTSGTSGRPKGALLTYGNFEASAEASAANLGVDAADRWLACMPLFHVGGLSIVLRSAIYGTTAVLHPRFEPVAVARALREDGITLLSVVPTMLQRMLDADDEPYPASVRAVLVGGGPVPRPLLEAALARGLPVLQTYGLTETASQVATLSAADAVRRLGSAGKPLPSTSVRIEADEGPTGPGEVGEIVVSGPTVSPGYLNDPEASAEALRDGWLHTGDVGYLDHEGYLYVVDRRDDLIVTGGENVYPAEVEAALATHPSVSECAVVGLPDRDWGSAVTAVVVGESGREPATEDLDAHVRGQLAAYKVPRRIVVSAEPLPRTASGKLLRRVVRDRLAGENP